MDQPQVPRDAVAEGVLADRVGVDVIDVGEHHRPAAPSPTRTWCAPRSARAPSARGRPVRHGALGRPLPHAAMMRSIELYGTRVAPQVREMLAAG